jgi:hypothetical protein
MIRRRTLPQHPRLAVRGTRRRAGRRFRIDRRQVDQAQPFGAGCQVAVQARSDAIQVPDRLAALVEQNTALLGHLLIPEVQLGRVAALLAQSLEQGISLGNGAVVLAQRPGVGVSDLAQGNVQVAPALARGPRHQVNVLRHKKYHAQPPDQVQGALGHAVDAHLFTDRRAVTAVGWRCQLQHQLQPLRFPPLADLRLQPGIGQRPIQGQPVDQLPLGRRARRATRSQQVDRLKQIGFALRVGPLQHSQPIGQTELQPAVVAEVREGKMIQSHDGQSQIVE